MKTLILTHEDIIKIISIIGVDTFMDESISKIEEFFKSLNKSYERKMRVGFLNNSPKSTIEVMPSRKIKEKSLFKIVNFHETNTKKGFPTVMFKKL